MTEIMLKPEFEKVVVDLGFTEFTEIQQQCIPKIQEGRDIIGLAHTGSGKTAAFGFPALEKVIPGKGIQVLVIVPTRELSNQVTKEFHKFTKYKRMHIAEIHGGVSINPQFDNLRRADVIVGTPGRLLDHLSRRTLHLDKVKVLVLDEADKMLEMGFIEDVHKIISQVPKTSQTLLFSATMSSEIMNLTKRYMKNPEHVKVQAYLDKGKIVQEYYDIDRQKKFSLLVHLLKHEQHEGLVLLFCGKRHIVDSVNKNLNRLGVKSHALHGGMTQNRRKEVMDAFRNDHVDVLVASDVAARGIDIKNITLVINYDMPKTSEEYIHRIGRTARAGSEGKVISLLAADDYDNFRRVLSDRNLVIQKILVPQIEQIPFVTPARHSRFGHGHAFGQKRNFRRR